MTTTKGDAMFVSVTSAIATRRSYDPDDDYTWPTVWIGDLDFPPLSTSNKLDYLFRFFNRVDGADADRLDAIGYKLPSLSVGDLVTVGTETFRVDPAGWSEVKPPAPCGWCRRCAIHDDPGGCLVVEDWVARETGAKPAPTEAQLNEAWGV